MPDRDSLDRLLDAALSNYAEPAPGLDRRVLARISAADAPRRRFVWLWPAAIAAAALLLVVEPWRSSLPPHTAPRATIAPPPARAAVEPPPAPRLAPPRLQHTAAPRAIAAPAPLPRLDIFPAPTPLSPQEQALARLIAQSSAKERNTLIAAQQEADAPIRISAISIPPLQPPDEGKE